MAKQTQLFLTKQYSHGHATFANSDTTTKKSLYAAGADDSKVTAIAITSTATADTNIQLFLYNGTTDFLIGTILVPASSGNSGTVAAVNGLSRTALPFVELNGNGIPFIPLETGYSLRASMLATIASGTVTVSVFAEDF
jgi:hypothetical protein